MLIIGVFLCSKPGYSSEALRLQVGTEEIRKRISRAEEAIASDEKLSRLLYGLDNPRVRNVLTDLMAVGYSQIGISRSEVEEMVRILNENKDNLIKARQALYDAGFDWTKKGNRYHDVYIEYKSKVRYNTTFNLIKGYIKEGDIIADVGSGNGELGRVIADNIKDTRVIAMDVVDPRKQTGYRPHSRVKVIKQPSNDKIPLPDNSADKVIFSAVFHHDTPKITDKLLAEAKRALKPNGRIIILEDVVLKSIPPRNNEGGLIDKLKKLTDEERKSVISIFDWHANHVVVGETKIPMALNYQTEEEWNRTFARAGFKIKTKDFVGVYKGKVHCHPHTVFVLKKALPEKDKLVTRFGPNHIYTLTELEEVARQNPDFVFFHVPSYELISYPGPHGFTDKKIIEEGLFRLRFLSGEIIYPEASNVLPVLLRRPDKSPEGASVIFLFSTPLEFVKSPDEIFIEEYYNKAERAPSTGRTLLGSLPIWGATEEFQRLRQKKEDIKILILGNAYSGNYRALIEQLRANSINASVVVMDYNSIPLETLKSKEFFRNDRDSVFQGDIAEMPLEPSVKFDVMYGDYILSSFNPAKIAGFFRAVSEHINSDGVVFLTLSCNDYFKTFYQEEIPFAFQMRIKENQWNYRGTFALYQKLAEQNGLQFKIVKHDKTRLEDYWDWTIGDYWIVITKITDRENHSIPIVSVGNRASKFGL